MSVHRHGAGWQVKWRDANGKRHGRTFPRKGDAQRADEDIKRRKAFGHELSGLFLDAPTTLTLAEFVDKGFRTHSAIRPQKTRDQYNWALNLHLQELVELPLVALTVPRLMEHQTFLKEHGRTPHTIRTVFGILGKMLQVAVDHGHLPSNAAHSMSKIDADPRPEIVPLNPAELETLIGNWSGRGRIACVLAGHLGLSPVEVRLAAWSGLSDDLGKLTVRATDTKRQRARTRVIDVPHHTRHELRAWRLESGGRGDTPIIGPINAHALRIWGHRTLKPRITTATGGRVDGSLYTLRHTHASLLHYCQYTPPEAAKRMGHSVAMHWRHYAHVVEALDGQPRFDDLDALIAWARGDTESRRAQQ